MFTTFLSRPYLLLLLLFSGNLQAGILDSGFTVQYQVFKNGTYLGVATRTLKHTSTDTIVFRSHTVPKGIVSLFVTDKITETTQLKLEQNKIIPLVYTYDQTGGKKETHYKMQFDWDTKRMLSTYNNKEHIITDGAQELLGFQLQLMLDLLHGKRRVDYMIANRKGVDSYTLKNAGSEVTQTEKGKYKSLKMESNITKKGDKYILWCAEGLNFLPVKIMRIEGDGDKIEFLLSSIKL